MLRGWKKTIQNCLFLQQVNKLRTWKVNYIWHFVLKKSYLIWFHTAIPSSTSYIQIRIPTKRIMKEVVLWISDMKFDKGVMLFTPFSVNSSSDRDDCSFALTISYSPMCLHIQLFKVTLWLLLPSCNSHPCIVLLHQLCSLCTDRPQGRKTLFSSSETSLGISVAWALFKEQRFMFLQHQIVNIQSMDSDWSPNYIWSDLCDWSDITG